MSDPINNNYFCETIQELLKKVAEAEGFSNYKIEKCEGSIKGEGYSGIIQAAMISDKNDKKVLHLVVKSAPKCDALRRQAPIEELFSREIYMYNKVFTIFKVFEKEKGLQPFDFIPKLYNFSAEEKHETLILENLAESGYKLYEKGIPMNEEHIPLVLTEYGHLHALSFALRHQNPVKFENIIGCLDECFVKAVLKIKFTNNIIQQCIIAQKALDEVQDKEALDVYKAFIDTIKPLFEENLLLEWVDKYSVALHGDGWTNNMMFKYEDIANPTKPTRVCFFDFQLSRLGSPVIDLSYFLYSCSSEEIINNLDHYLEMYYKTFSDYLRQLGSDPDKMFPYTIFLEHWKKYSKFGLMLSVLVIHLMLTEKEEVVSVADIAGSSEKELGTLFVYKIKKLDEYKRRVRPIILHFVKRGFI